MSSKKGVEGSIPHHLAEPKKCAAEIEMEGEKVMEREIVMWREREKDR
jgi:hypothetical protein